MANTRVPKGSPSGSGPNGMTAPQLNQGQINDLLTYARLAQEQVISTMSLRSSMEEIDRQYMREKNWTSTQWKARLANYAGDSTKIQDVTIPIVMPQVESALSYMVNVYLTGYPIFGVVSDPTNEDAAYQMNTIQAENANTFGWSRQLMMFFRDGLKYNIHGLEMKWDQKTVASLEQDATATNGVRPKVVLAKGNSLKRMDMYNTFFDTKVHPAEIHEHGEFAGYVEPYSRVRLKKYFANSLIPIPRSTQIMALNTAPATSMYSGSGAFSYYIPQINPFPLMQGLGQNGVMDWSAWFAGQGSNGDGENQRYNSLYQMMTLYARIVPKDFGLDVPEPNTPQVWKLVIVNGQIIISYERLSNAHNWIPIFFGQPLEDGLDYQTKSYAGNVTDMQNISSALATGFLASKRRLVTDRVLYNPAMIRKSDISSTDPAAKIPIRSSAYGKSLAEAVYQFPYRDDQADSLLTGVQLIGKMADTINGQNPSQQGQFVKGNRTLHEYDDVMGHGNGKNQSMAMMTEIQVFSPLKEAMKLNILQYQQADQKVNPSTKQSVDIDPVALYNAALIFEMTDGENPADKVLSTDELQGLMQFFTQNQAAASGYNISPMISYLYKTKNLDLSPFEKSPLQQQYEQQQQQWEQVAMAAIKTGGTPPPQPQPSPAYQQEMQQKGTNGGVAPAPVGGQQAQQQGQQ